MLKEIYSFTVDITREVEETSQEVRKNDEGQEEEVQVKKIVKKDVPVEFFIKKPSRRQVEDAETEFSICMSDCVKKGILTKAMLAKKYSDTGGAFAEEDAQELVDYYREIGQIEQEIAKMMIKGIDKSDPDTVSKHKKLSAKMGEVKRKIIDLETHYRTLFDHTADVKAQNRLLLWYITNLTYYKGLGIDIPDLTLFFKGDSFADKVNDYYEKDEEEDDLFLKAIGKVSTVVSYWYFSGNGFDKESLDDLLGGVIEEDETQNLEPEE